MFEMDRYERDNCGVGFLANLKGISCHTHLQEALHALSCMEHRGACGADRKTGDGAGIMTDIPFELFGYENGSVAVASLLMPRERERQKLSLRVFEDTFAFLGLKVIAYREVPINTGILGKEAIATLPAIKHAIIQRPKHCRTNASFDKLLYAAKQYVRTKQKENGIVKEFFFTSLSANTIVYKALCTAGVLDQFYLDLQNPDFKTRFALFHRRFSTNTRTTWDKIQPFRIIAHNGEINTIAGNRSWALSREKYLGLRKDELLTHSKISDSGSLNEMVEALMYRSSIPHVDNILALMIPPAHQQNSFYRFWSRAMEPWDGPAAILFSDGRSIGARLDRNGFRPARWLVTEDMFYLSSEAGSFEVDESQVLKKGALHAGSGVTVDLERSQIHFSDPGCSRENRDAYFDARLVQLSPLIQYPGPLNLHQKNLFNYTQEDMDKMLIPMIREGKEPVGSMGDTARLTIFSEQPRSFFDYFYQKFAQVTNPPLDFMRERLVTDLKVHLGKRPNIFSKKELLPLQVALEADSPILSLSQMQYIEDLKFKRSGEPRIVARSFDLMFKRSEGGIGFENSLKRLRQEVLQTVANGVSIVILTDRHSDYENPPIPSLIGLRAVVNILNDSGLRLRASIVVHSAEIKNSHHVAALIGFGAAAVCPYLALEIACYENHLRLSKLATDQKEKNILKALEDGLLKIMAKSGISVVRSYQSAKRFTAIGLGESFIHQFFPGLTSPIGGIGMKELVENILLNTEYANDEQYRDKLLNTYLYREHNKGLKGEKHTMTSARSKIAHKLLQEASSDFDASRWYQEYLKLGAEAEPVNVRHLFAFKSVDEPLLLDEVESIAQILARFGSGAMSFGAISAEAQRDIFLAMKAMGGRSNSGEGGENPYYYTDGITAHTKQVASARFGVTAEYLITGEEIQIKIAQGAKPGEGGQLMAVKVTDDIARARHAIPGIDLISPPPLHDIYSIEDLKELIYELKQLKPGVKVSVKLVAGANVGTIAVGVAKAGADIIYISGFDGGTGAAVLSSMKHAGLPWEFGVIEAHRALVDNNLRNNVELRTDGGLHTGKDIVTAAILGAEGYDFGKLLLVAQGCIMARVCEKNTCPRGIATHDPKFKANYQGTPQDIIKMLTYLAEDVRRHLAALGVHSLDEILGRTDRLIANPIHGELMEKRKINLNGFFVAPVVDTSQYDCVLSNEISPLNRQILTDCSQALAQNRSLDLFYPIQTTDRAVLATLAGEIAKRTHAHRFSPEISEFNGKIHLTFRGSAGQGFAVFMTEGIEARLYGEANDSVGKSMSGGKVVIRPHPGTTFVAEQSTIIGNCALYGATGGILYVSGLAGDRFAVRNSGATAVVEGVGLHACEYMTNGMVIILGEVSHNVGAGMTGGVLYMYGDQKQYVNHEYLIACKLNEANESELKALLNDFLCETGSTKARKILADWEKEKQNLKKYLPLGLFNQQEVVTRHAVPLH